VAWHKRVALCIAAMVVLCLGRASFALEAPPAGNGGAEPDMRRLLDDLRSTFWSNRSDKVQAIVERAQQAPQDVSVVIQDVADNLYETDTSYVANCIVALTMLKARAATDVLIESLDSPAGETRYQAAWALGQIWQDESPPSDQLQRINGALLGAVYEASYAGEPAGCYGPGVALALINKIGNESSSTNDVLERTFEGLSPEQLRQTIDGWARSNPGKLPALEDQPWALLLNLVLHGSDQGPGAAAILVREKPLGAVAAITSLLRNDNSELSEEALRQLGTVLTGITGVEFPNSSNSRSEQVDAWTGRWTDSLKQRTDQPARVYVLQEYTRAAQEFQVFADAAIAERAQRFKDTLLSMLKSPQDIPTQAPRATRSLLEEGLKLKQSLQQHLGDLNRTDILPSGKQEHINAMRSELEAPVYLRDARGVLVRDPSGRFMVDEEAMALKKEIARQFVPSLVDFARKEQHVAVLGSMALLLEAITDVPCSLASTSDEGRKRAIDQWLAELSKKEHPSESPDSSGNP